MATNPNRPEYQDTIESTWGQSVADHVIRRYATAAERDADLAALTPADLEGQVVAITGAAPYLWQYSGGVWEPIAGMPAGKVVQSATVGATGATWVPIPCPVVEYLRGGVEASGGGLLIPADGAYELSLCSGSICGNGGAAITGGLGVRADRGGVQLAQGYSYAQGYYPVPAINGPFTLKAGDVLTMSFLGGTGQWSDPAQGAMTPGWIAATMIGSLPKGAKK